MYLLETVEIIFLNLIVTFWNCCFALFKSSLRSTEQSRYLRACKIHGAKRGSHDRRFTDFGVAICSCRPIEVIAVHAVNSGPNNPDYSRSSSFLHFLSFSLSLSFPLPSAVAFTLTLLLRDPTNSRCYFASAKRFVASTEYVLWRKAIRETSTKTAIYPNRTPWSHTRREHLQPT